VPKRLALLNPEGIASAMAQPMEVISAIAFPLVRLMNFATNLVLWMLRVRAPMHPPITEEEINVLMEQGAEAGVFEKHEQALVSRIFRMDDQPIRRVMTPRGDIVYFDLNDSFETNRQKLLRRVTRGSLSARVDSASWWVYFGRSPYWTPSLKASPSTSQVMPSSRFTCRKP